MHKNKNKIFIHILNKYMYYDNSYIANFLYYVLKHKKNITKIKKPS